MRFVKPCQAGKACFAEVGIAREPGACKQYLAVECGTAERAVDTGKSILLFLVAELCLVEIRFYGECGKVKFCRKRKLTIVKVGACIEFYIVKPCVTKELRTREIGMPPKFRAVKFDTLSEYSIFKFYCIVKLNIFE